ncbi:MAG: alkaline phosphatase [Tannerella sp.]|jgi:alkaline phosphatase|nr:alkaline phosphatase [Tannerella sp.]
MNKRILLSCLLVFILIPAKSVELSEVKPVKNLIVMIPDGTSLATVSIARWYQWYLDPARPKLNIDAYLCGTVQTFSSNAPIGDSAPTTSCYMTGYPSRAGYVSTYPPSAGNDDIYPLDPAKAYQPLTTLLEAAKLTQRKATGLVFTCEFPHATPADCSSHSYDRGRYDWISSQMVHNDLDVVIGGGVSLLSETDEAYLKANGYGVYKNDMAGMRAERSNRMWALYNEKDMTYDLDRDASKEPSIEEMTRTAIEKLSKNETGFFLMVEGSKVDWAAHANDPVGMITEFLAFDRACRAALEFAEKDGETLVVIVPDHGNSGISLGSRNCRSYGTATKDDLFGTISQVKRTAEGIAARLNASPSSAVQQIFREDAGFELAPEELNTLYQCRSYENSPVPKNERSDKDVLPSLYSSSLNDFVAKLITSKTCFGFTTGGHTGEEVFLAAYHPAGSLPIGMNTNVELNRYMAAALGLNGRLDELTAEYFAPHAQVFDGYTCRIVPPADKKDSPTLVVKNGKKQLTITPNTNIVKAGNKGQEEIRLRSVVIYVDKNETFYLPKSLTEYLK